MKKRISESLIFFIYISSISFTNINTKIISEGYHFFDIFYYRDFYQNIITQKKNNKCTIEDGPSCYYIKSKDENLISSELKSLYKDKELFKQETNEKIYSKIKAATKSIQGKDVKEIEEEIYSFDTPYMVSLYLTFESYDEKTKDNDIYAPETIDNEYESGRLTLTISGKLRLSQKNAEKYESKLLVNLREEGPKKTYAYVESKEVIFKFSSKSSINYLYIKKNRYNLKNKNFYLYGYANGHRHIISKVENVPSSRWIKVNGNGEMYDSIGLIRGFDYDNFVINALATKDEMFEVSKLSKKYYSAFNEKINEVISQIVNGLKTDDIKSSDLGPGVKVVQVNLNQNDLVPENEEEFEIPDEIMEEINKNEKDKNNENEFNNKENKGRENINKQDL